AEEDQARPAAQEAADVHVRRHAPRSAGRAVRGPDAAPVEIRPVAGVRGAEPDAIADAGHPVRPVDVRADLGRTGGGAVGGPETSASSRGGPGGEDDPAGE